MFPGLHPMAMMSTVGFGLPRGVVQLVVWACMVLLLLPIHHFIPRLFLASKALTLQRYASGASVKIAPLEDDGRPTEQTERKVTIVGTPEAQWKVGRIIGKGGQNVRDLQRQTGSVIKLPQQGTTTSEETTVHILGPFFSVQSAQRRIRAIIQMSTAPSSGRGSRGPTTSRVQ
ncbi:putative insulin-like growth factor 2 mRNA-binding protein 1 isoform X1 [Penaeus vannamei]|uniref:Putative insulin-like growth factor 2 mRNA-binding protein 1 isoform X1 n=1 Tax=Penaeus vannamei TaxID=6689 RepID=A0A3R7PCP5_PENVA|nr:putative insulin-like growth factor 2 mRNA-binding protein 1 isoform X1 [Penaeus vannamei]